jgi:hypothetical protein
LPGRIQPACTDTLARQGTGWRLRSHKHHHALLRFTAADDPNDNETSDDPNDDDDAYEDMTALVDRDAPVAAGAGAPVAGPNSAVSPPAIPSIPPAVHLLLPQRLRC